MSSTWNQIDHDPTSIASNLAATSGIMNTAVVDTTVTRYHTGDDGDIEVISTWMETADIHPQDGDLVGTVLDYLERHGVQFRRVNSEPHIAWNAHSLTGTLAAASADTYTDPDQGWHEETHCLVTGHHRLLRALTARTDHWVNQ